MRRTLPSGGGSSLLRRRLSTHFCDIVGDVFYHLTLNSRWLTSTVLALAQSIFTDRAFDRMPILADALEDAGYDNADIVAHCRGPGPHARGCWVIDKILGKE
jgi:hypothetical protein